MFTFSIGTLIEISHGLIRRASLHLEKVRLRTVAFRTNDLGLLTMDVALILVYNFVLFFSTECCDWEGIDDRFHDIKVERTCWAGESVAKSRFRLVQVQNVPTGRAKPVL